MAICYGAAIAITLVSVVGLLVIDRGHGSVVAGWAFCTSLLFAIGRLADLARVQHK